MTTECPTERGRRRAPAYRGVEGESTCRGAHTARAATAAFLEQIARHDPIRLPDLLKRRHAALMQHSRKMEAPGGLFEAVRRRAPALRGVVDALRAEHTQLLAEIFRLARLSHRARGGEELARGVAVFDRRMSAHTEHEARLSRELKATGAS